MEKQPCSNCRAAGASCQVLPSRRGRYPRRSRRLLQQVRSESVTHASSDTGQSTPLDGNAASSHPLASDTQDQAADHHSGHLPAVSSPSSPTPANTPGTRFYGESSFLTLVPGEDEGTSSQPNAPGGGGGRNNQKPRFTFPMPPTPQSASQTAQGGAHGLSTGLMRYLADEGALTLPDLESCLPALQAYFAWFHPSYPILDRAQIARRLASATSFSGVDMSRMLLQAMLLIGATYCDAATIRAMGFQDRSQAKTAFYTRARLLFHADWEKDETVLIQSLFLMSFWRGAPADVRDVRYWLGVVITLAESYGLHRSSRSMSKDSYTACMRRRIWWSIYVRERQASASLGLPSRIRDEDCDIEPLTPMDLESEVGPVDSSFGSCQPEHVTYAIKMVEIAKLLGRIIDLHFVPGHASLSSTSPDTLHDLNASLEAWMASLPEDMKYSPDHGNDSVWACLLHLAYNHLKILIHRNSFLRLESTTPGSQVVIKAACRISRIAEDMSTQGTLRYGQMHLITSIFSALCIHTITIRRGSGLTRRLAEHRAETCLLCLKEVQKYWRININILDFFLQYLDRSIAARLHGMQSDAPPPPSRGVGRGGEAKANDAKSITVADAASSSENANPGSMPYPRVDYEATAAAAAAAAPTLDLSIPALGPGHYLAQEEFREQYLGLVSQGDDVLGDWDLFLQGEDFSQTGSGFNVLERSL
ncbi:N-terminal binuclear Zn cluster-containing/DNA binding domain-containing protein [Trichoderma citrinoviride]|uniref:N-terminal binuclear Zn cluster-containing/DNA binding domain-containing protein n=1 Tax=Trichoderma citrinoviride TaxID=58853 RepID=A0A2T4AZ69_9HYPO|nr:N-terminal binuclear Zn cluster-containing/DNA binding domain-containing protein [Trichoderma citrinoviride]PTB62367.1 N-terminal binuclear Zn cluster-containing/DNA binding domain-containing protein [Trichoderma citrinoviride]